MKSYVFWLKDVRTTQHDMESLNLATQNKGGMGSEGERHKNLDLRCDWVLIEIISLTRVRTSILRTLCRLRYAWYWSALGYCELFPMLTELYDDTIIGQRE